jgi:hypothetical protein
VRTAAATTLNSSALKIWLRAMLVFVMVLLPGSPKRSRSRLRLTRTLPIALRLVLRVCVATAPAEAKLDACRNLHSYHDRQVRIR